MPQNNEITTFQFLEAIQQTFLKSQESDGSASTQFQTRRMVNFFDNTATLHVLKTESENQSNGESSPVATLLLQGVTKDDEFPTFAVKIDSTKILVLIQDDKSLQKEARRVVKFIETSIEKNAQQEVPAEPVAEKPVSPSPTTETEETTRERPRRSRLRDRDSAED